MLVSWLKDWINIFLYIVCACSFLFFYFIYMSIKGNYIFSIGIFSRVDAGNCQTDKKLQEKQLEN